MTAYFLFFSISITSFFGLTETLTGSHAQSTYPIIFGLSFYTASLAYLLVTKPSLSIVDGFKVSNPLLLSTGPIVCFIKNYRYRKILFRLNYYLPFLIVGVFYYRTIAVPLTEAFSLIEETDLVSSIVFASIFELFVYANFCGLSLIIYGVFGILGYKIPLNFRQPFSSKNIIEFWKGWHTSLSAVLKSLFYAPLRKKFSSGVALFGVYMASAMWHGVTFNFVLWGTFHALMFIVSIYILKRNVRILPFIFMIFAIVVGRLIFADSNTDRLLQKLSFNYDGFGAIRFLGKLSNTTKVALIFGVIVIGIELFFQNTKAVAKRNYKHLRSPLALFILVAMIIAFANNIGVNFAVYGQR